MENRRSDVWVEFLMVTKEDKRASREAGRAIFRDVEYCHIKFPGDNKRELYVPAHESSIMDKGSGRHISYAERFPEHYKRFKDGQSEAIVGTPLDMLPFLLPSQRAELRALNIHTAEALAGLPDAQGKRMGMGWRTWKEQAAAWLDKAEGSADSTRLAAENAELKERLERLEAMITQPKALVMEGATGGDQGPGPGADFANWDAEDIKAFLADVTGAKPKGNPSHATLVRLATEAVQAKESEAA